MEVIMPVVDITVEQLQNSYDWAEVFGEGSGGNCTNEVDECPPGSSVSREVPTRADVSKVIAAVEGERNGDSWLGVFLLKDGRYLVASGSCDYTGWGCRAGNSLEVAATLEEA